MYVGGENVFYTHECGQANCNNVSWTDLLISVINTSLQLKYQVSCQTVLKWN